MSRCELQTGVHFMPSSEFWGVPPINLQHFIEAWKEWYLGCIRLGVPLAFQTSTRTASKDGRDCTLCTLACQQEITSCLLRMTNDCPMDINETYCCETTCSSTLKFIIDPKKSWSAKGWRLQDPTRSWVRLHAISSNRWDQRLPTHGPCDPQSLQGCLGKLHQLWTRRSFWPGSGQ